MEMNMNEIGALIVAIITALGGIKLIEFLGNNFLNRKKRQSGETKDILADRMDMINDQFKFLDDKIQKMKEDIVERDVRIDKLQNQVNKLIDDRMEMLPSVCYNFGCETRNRLKNNTNLE